MIREVLGLLTCCLAVLPTRPHSVLDSHLSVTARLQRDLLTETAAVVRLKPYEFTQSIVRKDKGLSAHERLFNFKNVQFLGHLYVGTPPQEFIVIYDTGSSLLWVTGQCRDGGCQHHNHFDPDASSTFIAAQSEPTQEYIQYGTGSCVLDLGQDTILLGDLEVTNQSFGASSRESLHPFVDVPTDGLVGMVLDDGIIENIKRQGKLKRNIFAIYFSSQPSQLGSISWGSVDPRFAKNPIYEPVWIPLVDDDYWRVKIEGIKIGEKYAPLCGVKSATLDEAIRSIHHPRPSLKASFVTDRDSDSSASDFDEAPPKRPLHRRNGPGDDLSRDLLSRRDSCTAAVDTGSSLITVPQSYLDILHETFSDLGHDIDEIDCSKKHSFPSIGIVMRSVDDELVEFTLDADDYIVEAEDGDSDSACLFGIMPMDVPPPRGPLLVLGVTFLQKYYSIFDFENYAVGFTTSV